MDNLFFKIDFIIITKDIRKMPQSKEYYKQWYQANKERKAEYNKKYRIENETKYSAKASKKHYDNNPHFYKIKSWKHAGMIDTDWDLVYEMFIAQKHCWICGCGFNNKRKCLDHDHETGELRYVVCVPCNIHIIG